MTPPRGVGRFRTSRLIQIKKTCAPWPDHRKNGGFTMFGKMRRARSQLFGEMMRRFGVSERPDYGHLEGAKLQAAAARCIHCSDAARCKTWVEQTSGTEGAEEFCPNAGTFAALADRADR
jgi:hypothetical protein